MTPASAEVAPKPSDRPKYPTPQARRREAIRHNVEAYSANMAERIRLVREAIDTDGDRAAARREADALPLEEWCTSTRMCQRLDDHAQHDGPLDIIAGMGEA